MQLQPAPSMAPIKWLLLLTLCAGGVATTGPIFAFRFEGTTISEDGTTLTPQGSGFTYVAGVNGGQAAYFPLERTAYLVSQPLAKLPSGNSARSVSHWLMLSSYPTGITTLTSWGSASSFNAFSTRFDGGTNTVGLVFDAYDLPGFTYVMPSINVWHHIAFTFDGTKLAIYIDGVSVFSSVVPNTAPWSSTPYTVINTAASTALVVGGLGMGTWCSTCFLHGAIDDLFIFDRALSPGEVAALAVPSAAPTVTATTTFTPSVTGTPSSTTAPSCLPSAYTFYPYSDLSGSVLSVTLGASSEKDCQLTCCSTVGCTGYSWAGLLPNLACFLFANVTGITPNLLFSSGMQVAATPPPTPSATAGVSISASQTSTRASSTASLSTAASVLPQKSPTSTAQVTKSGTPLSTSPLSYDSSATIVGSATFLGTPGYLPIQLTDSVINQAGAILET